MIPRSIQEWVKGKLASIGRKHLVRGRSSASFYSLDAYQAGTDEPESADEAQRFQHYGFLSEVPDHCEGITLAVHGCATNRVAIAERQGQEPSIERGEVVLWTPAGQRVLLTKDGDVVVYPKTGRDVILGTDSAGGADKVVTEGRLQDILDTIAGHNHTAPPMGGITTASSQRHGHHWQPERVRQSAVGTKRTPAGYGRGLHGDPVGQARLCQRCSGQLLHRRPSAVLSDLHTARPQRPVRLG